MIITPFSYFCMYIWAVYVIRYWSWTEYVNKKYMVIIIISVIITITILIFIKCCHSYQQTLFLIVSQQKTEFSFQNLHKKC